MFYHLHFVAEDKHEHEGVKYEIRVFRARADEGGHFRVYISTDAISTVIIEGVDMPGEVADDMKHQRTDDPVAYLIRVMKDEIDAGRVHLE